MITVIAVAAYQIREDNQQLTLNNNSLDPQNQANYNTGNPNNTTNQGQSNNLQDKENSNNQTTSTAQETGSKDNYDSRSIASKYIEEPNAVAGEPKRVKIDGKSTDVVPVISNGKQVGEIHIDPETGENVGGAGGAP